MGAGNHKYYDPSKAEANDRLGLSPEEVGGYFNYRNYGPSGHIQTIDEWAKDQRRGVFADEANPPGELPKPGTTLVGDNAWWKPFTDLQNTAPKKPGTPKVYTEGELGDLRVAQRMTLKENRGRASTFLTGPTGLTSTPMLSG